MDSETLDSSGSTPQGTDVNATRNVTGSSSGKPAAENPLEAVLRARSSLLECDGTGGCLASAGDMDTETAGAAQGFCHDASDVGHSGHSCGDTAYILSLDEGLLHKVLSCLAANDLLSAQCTCRQLNTFICSSPDLWKSLLIPYSMAQRLTDARLMVLVSRANGSLEALELRGGKELTGSFLLSEGMKASTNLRKLWLLECPNLSSSAVVSLVGHIVQTCSQEGLTHRLSSIRLAGSSNIYGKHVRLLEKLLLPPTRLDVQACPTCPKAGSVLVCHMVTLLEALAGEGAGQPYALVRGGEIGCESCLIPCCLCQERYCRAHLFNLPCGISGICCQCCGYHRCRLCGTS